MHFHRPSSFPRRSGFTLVEILVAMAVLSIVAVGLLQILSLSMQTWQQGLAQTNCYTKARVVLDSVTADIQRGVFRPDLKNFPTPTSTLTPTFTFSTRDAGATTGTTSVRPVSLVTYQMSGSAGLQGCLLRSEQPINWGGTSTSTGTTNLSFYQSVTSVTAATGTTTAPPPDDLLCTGVAGFEMVFLLSNGSTVLAKYYQTPTASPVVMIGVAVAVIDDQAMTQLQPTVSPNFGNIQKALETALFSNSNFNNNFSPMTLSSSGSYTSSNAVPERSIKELWDPAMLSIFQSPSYPKSLASGFQTFERFVPCTSFN
jgi:prepilin-type N-terminal cleavage/methylation domain-containing protein